MHASQSRTSSIRHAARSHSTSLPTRWAKIPLKKLTSDWCHMMKMIPLSILIADNMLFCCRRRLLSNHTLRQLLNIDILVFVWPGQDIGGDGCLLSLGDRISWTAGIAPDSHQISSSGWGIAPDGCQISSVGLVATTGNRKSIIEMRLW